MLIGEKVRIGGVLKDVGTSMKYTSTSAPLPMSLRAGIACSPVKDFNLLLDGEYLKFARPNVHFGIEYWVKEMIALRAGLKTKPNDGPLSYYTAGLGIKYQQFYLDYAFVPYSSDLGMTHRVLVGTRFGELTPLGSAAIRVYDAKTQRPLAAELTIVSTAITKASTDSVQGLYYLKDQPPGMFRIKAQRAKYYPTEETLTVVKDVSRTKAIALNPIPPGEIIGLVTDVKTKRVLGARVGYDGIVRGEVTVDSMVGLYRLSSLEPGKYVLRVMPFRPKYYPQTCTLEVEPGKTVVRDFELLREREVIILRGVNFETAKATLLPESYPILDQAGKILVENPQVIVELGGHTDNRRIRTKEFPSNLQLSQARAESVRDYLLKAFNIAPDRLVAKGYADKQPIATNKTQAGRAQNRRTEFKVLSGAE
jgi:outer membrane protein OmpA-like peptidoglycan-associated protein